MPDPNNFIIGANDEHGLNPPTVSKRTPLMPYIERNFYENEFNSIAKQYFIAACLRVGFNVFDVKPEQQDISISNRITRVNSQNLACLVTFAYNAYGSGASFNNAQGFEVFYSTQNSFAASSRELSDNIYNQIATNTDRTGRKVKNLNVSMLTKVNCPSSLIEAGFMTNFTEAKLMLDPDYAMLIGESACVGVCGFLGVPYIERNNINAYPTIRKGSRSNAVRLLQYLLIQNSFNVQTDSIFGNETENAVLTFQRNNSLNPDGIVGRNTWTTLLNLDPAGEMIRIGDKGSNVTYLQRKLLSKLYPAGFADGIFGAQTERAVRAFQTENGLNSDGIVGPQTWSRIMTLNEGRTISNTVESGNYNK